MSPAGNRDQLIAYLATLVALVVIFVASLIASKNGVTVNEAFGLGTITGGLIGLMRTPQQRQVQIDQPVNQPVPTKETNNEALDQAAP